MNNIKFFHIRGGKATVFTPQNQDFSEPMSADCEEELHKLCEDNLEPLFDVRFLQNQFFVFGGRIDTLGLDRENRLVIIEYKIGYSPTIINQAAYYLASLGDDSGLLRQRIVALVTEKLGGEIAQRIDWNNPPRLICVARKFRENDIALQKLIQTLELVRYDFFDEKQSLRLEWIDKSTPLITEEQLQLQKDYHEWQTYIVNEIGKKQKVFETYRSRKRRDPCPTVEAPHYSFARKAQSVPRAGFAVLEAGKYPVKIWARKNFSECYCENSSWHKRISSTDPKEEQENMKKLLREAYKQAYQSKRY